MLVEEGTSANLEPGPGMSEGVLPGLNGEGIGNLENVDANLEIATRSAILYKILFGVLGVILALAVLLKIIGGCMRMQYDNEDNYLKNYVNKHSKLRQFFIALKRVAYGANEEHGANEEYGASKVYAANEKYEYHGVASTTLGDIIFVGFVLKGKIAELLYKTKRPLGERVHFEENVEEGHEFKM